MECGRSNVCYSAWPLKFLVRSFILIFSSTCRLNVNAQGDEDVEALPAEPCSLLSVPYRPALGLVVTAASS